jgi:ATP-dependent DNA helicase RecG
MWIATHLFPRAEFQFYRIFPDRVEITNGGRPLIDTLRFADEPPQSRNESLGSFMRRVGICEERGSGIDKVLAAIELFQLPAPHFEVTQNHTRVTLFAPRDFKQMGSEERIRACYWHACLLRVTNTQMTNATLRNRLSIPDSQYTVVSKVIRDALDKGLIKLYDPDNQSKKHTRYVPFWA